MPTTYPLPMQEAVRDLLTDLLGRSAAVDKVKPFRFGADDRGVVACYEGDDGQPGVLVLIDDQFAARAGAALVMMPAAAAETDLKKGDLNAILENVAEVLNIFVTLLNTEHTPHLRLRGVHLVPGDMPADVRLLLTRPETRRDYAVFIEGYGQGRLSILAR